MDTSIALQFGILILLLLLSAFFSSAETALTTANRIKMKALADEGDKRARTVLTVTEDSGKMLSAILIGNNVVNLSAASLTTTIALNLWGNAAIAIASGVLTVLVLIFGEITPKTLATIHSDNMARAYAGVVLFLMKLLTPVIFIINNLAHVVLLLLRVDPSAKGPAMTEGELRTIVDVSHEDGVIESEEREMIYNVFDFSDAVAKDIMIPRINMVTVGVEDTYDEVLNVFRESMYTRLPVYQDDNDNIIGIVNIKDFILAEKEQFRVQDILREAHYTYEFKRVADLLIEIREKTTSVTFVLNEYGATVGMITLEDLLEEIVGEIRDEYDADEVERLKNVGERTWLVEGSMKLDDINDELGTTLDSEDYDSISGLIIESLDRLPEDNEEVTLANGIRLKVQGIDQNRVKKVLMTLPEEEEDLKEDEADTGEERA